jgi:hypothetical protein
MLALSASENSLINKSRISTGSDYSLSGSFTNHMKEPYNLDPTYVKIGKLESSQKPSSHSITYSIKSLPKDWARYWGLIIAIAKIASSYQSLYQFFFRLPLPTFIGQKLLTVDFTLRFERVWYEHIHLLSGHIKIQNIIPNDSLAIKACLDGNIGLLREIFKFSKASANDMTTDARPLLWVRQ